MVCAIGCEMPWTAVISLAWTGRLHCDAQPLGPGRHVRQRLIAELEQELAEIDTEIARLRDLHANTGDAGLLDEAYHLQADA
jgi:hypothetical protein